jgi:hypothetical protein
MEHNLEQGKTQKNAGNFEPKNYRHFGKTISTFNCQCCAGMKRGHLCRLNICLRRIAAGGVKVRRMREGGRIPVRKKKGKRSAIVPIRGPMVAVSLFSFWFLFLSLLCKGGVGGWVLFLLSLFPL